MIQSKLGKLKNILKELDSAVIAFSGGVDSSYLLYMAHKVNKEGIVAVTIKTPYIPSREIDEAIEFTKKHGIKHHILNLSFPEIIRNNPVERCYICKKTLFSQILDYARTNKYKSILDGTNSDDRGDFRPGMKALKEMNIISPLLESGITKSEIREHLRSEGLHIWDKPAMACLLTRIPYDTEIKYEMLKMIEDAENFLSDAGYPGTRVRVHDDIARIECLPGYLEKITHSPGREEIVNKLKKIGFRYISLDLEGYRTGSLNPEK